MIVQNKKYIFFCYLSFLISCATSLLNKDYVKSFNKRVEGKAYIAIKDIKSEYADAEDEGAIVYTKGTELRIVLEQNDDWIKVRAYPFAEPKEQAGGKLIYYYIHRFGPSTSETLNKQDTPSPIPPYSSQNLEEALKKIIREK